MLNLTWQSRLKTRRCGHGSLSGGESRKHWEEGAGGERKKRQHSMCMCGGPTWASCPPFLGRGGREGDRQLWQRWLQLLCLAGKTRSRGGAATALRAPSVRDKTHMGLATCPRHTTLCCRAEAYSCSQGSSSKIFCSQHLSTASLITMTHNNGLPGPPHLTAIP